MRPLSKFLIIINLFLVILIQANTGSVVNCDAEFLDLIQRCSNSKSTKVFYSLSMNVKIDTSNETEYIEWLEKFCLNAIKESQCLADVKFKLPDKCYNLIYLKYLIVDKHNEETNMLCGNNAEGFKKLIPNDGFNLYFNNNIHFNTCPDKIYSDITSLLSNTEVCEELKINQPCYQKISSVDDIYTNVNGLRFELNQRLMVRLNCTR